MASKLVLLAICLGCFALLSVSGVAAFPFSSDISPPFFNKIETSSTTNLKTAAITTELGNRFVTGSADGGVEIVNNVQISSYSDGIPSKGSVSAFIKGATMEGGYATTNFGIKPQISSSFVSGKLTALEGITNNVEKSSGLFMTTEFYDFTSMDGDIISFSKFMSYHSALISS